MRETPRTDEATAIEAAHPMATGRHDIYAEAMRLVGDRHEKGELVDLVNWLLADLAAARAEVESLQNELEHERLRLAACGVVALANTPESAKAARAVPPDYMSGSLQDVMNAVDREMALRVDAEARAKHRMDVPDERNER